MEPKQRQVLCLSKAGFHHMAYTQWGEDPTLPMLICAHGLTRNGRDFDALATALSDRYRIACPDVVGRGRSGWLADPALYQYQQYLYDLTTLMARLGTDQVDWVGTSMGGVIGMLIAAQPNSPIRRLVLNDIGPFIPAAALEEIGHYLGQSPDFADLETVTDFLSEVNAGFGPLTREQWRHLARHSVRQLKNGELRLAYDPGIANVFSEVEGQDVDLWQYWDRIQCPVLVIRGEHSPLLQTRTVADMRGRGPPEVKAITFAGAGHAPALMADDQIAQIRDWLTQPTDI